jgi:dynein heavy chain, axonemal
MIDPQLQANKWLKVNEAANKLSVLNFNNSNYLKVLEMCVSSGYPVLIEEVEETL